MSNKICPLREIGSNTGEHMCYCEHCALWVKNPNVKAEPYTYDEAGSCAIKKMATFLNFIFHAMDHRR